VWGRRGSRPEGSKDALQARPGAFADAPRQRRARLLDELAMAEEFIAPLDERRAS
jgi:hypothetical protein